MSDTELLSAIQRGDHNSYKELISRYQTKLKNVAYGIVHNWDDAEDIVQDAFVDVFRHVHKFRGDSSISTWIYRITVNKSLNHLRKLKNRGWMVGSLDVLLGKKEIYTLADEEKNQEATDERIQKLHAAVNKLTNSQKKAFTLFFYEELSQKEIAAILKTTTSSVEQLIFRAKQKIKKQLSL